ncbi:MAG TPA: hypothetical protein VGE13_01605 [Candidatus Saccharimonadales bacterium]
MNKSSSKIRKTPRTIASVEETAEFLKERIYATITLLALLATLWHGADHFTAKGAIVSVLGTVVALWLAIGIASRMSYQVVHGKRMSTKAYTEILRHHSALLIPAFPVVVLILISLTGLFSLKTALLASLITLLLSFVGFSLLAGRRMRSSWTEIAITSGFEIALGLGVIALKIYAGH